MDDHELLMFRYRWIDTVPTRTETASREKIAGESLKIYIPFLFSLGDGS